MTIRCAIHHSDIGLCGCDPDEQYREAQVSRVVPVIDSMVERVAIAIHARISEELAKADKPNWGPWETADEGSKTIYRSAARAALEALKEPTEQMLGGFASYIDGRGTALAVWEDMIEQALGEY